MAKFPSVEWVKEYSQKLNENKSYEEAARTWEGDFLFIITPDEGLDRLDELVDKARESACSTTSCRVPVEDDYRRLFQ